MMRAFGDATQQRPARGPRGFDQKPDGQDFLFAMLQAVLAPENYF
jgi:hypothetical protein